MGKTIVSGGFLKDGLRILEKTEYLSKDNTYILNGLSIASVAFYIMGMTDIFLRFIDKIEHIISVVENKQKNLIKRFSDCMKMLNKDFVLKEEDLKELPDIPLNFKMYVELINLKTGEVFLKQVNSTKEALVYSLNQPFLLKPNPYYIFETSYLSHVPILSLFNFPEKELYFLIPSSEIYREHSIDGVLAKCAFFRSKFLFEEYLFELQKSKVLHKISF